MAIRLAPKGKDIFTSSAKAIVIPVNTVGVMGKGLARSCAIKYPAIEAAYKELCVSRKLVAGSVERVEHPSVPFDVWLFATKAHWSHPSKLTWIESGLHDLALSLRLRYGDTNYHIALPALGCGLGGLAWPEVYTTIVRILTPLPYIIDIYAPQE